jgi:hypothetical protein
MTTPTTLTLEHPRVAFFLLAGTALVGCGLTSQHKVPIDQRPVQDRFEQDGETYSVIDGDVYQLRSDGRLKFIDHLYDPDFFAKNYRSNGDELVQVDPRSGDEYSVTRTFRDGFEDVSAVSDLFGETQWHRSNCDPERAGRSENYYDQGNRVEISREVVHSGRAALRFSAQPSSKDVSKCSLTKGIFFFEKGDVVHFSGWFFLEKVPSIYDGGGFTFFDLETSFFSSHTGIRTFIRGKEDLAFELELPKTSFRQDRGREVEFPTDRWVHVEAKILLSDEEGRVQMWQDGAPILDRVGRTLPLANTIYDQFEIGISAMAPGARYEKILYVDDVALSAEASTAVASLLVPASGAASRIDRSAR